MRISDWSSDVCSSDLVTAHLIQHGCQAVDIILYPVGDGSHFVARSGRACLAAGAVIALDKENERVVTFSLPIDLIQDTAKLCVLIRSEERRVGKECVSTCRSRGWPYPKKKNKIKMNQ